MSEKTTHIRKMGWYRSVIATLLFFLFAVSSYSQDTIRICTIKDGQLYIWLSKNLPEKELNDFIRQYDLGDLALKKFIETGFRDSLIKYGWKVGLNNSSSFTLFKPLESADDLISPADRINFISGQLSLEARFPRVSSSIQYGYNQFRNKEPFAVRERGVEFFLRGNTKARKVMLAGSFNNWDPDVLPMTVTDSGWIAYVKLLPGKFWYKFVVDGSWTIDTDNRRSENDGEGNTNSVFFVPNTLFRLEGFEKARRVIVSGSFNDWGEKQLQLEKTAGGWSLPVFLADGTHTYRFIVDGRWMEDPANPDHFPNEFGQFNSVVRKGESRIFRLEGHQDARKVVLTGSFNEWHDYELMMQKKNGGWEIPYTLGEGNYEYAFIVDGRQMADSAHNASSGTKSSMLILAPNHRFRLAGFADAKKIFVAGDFNNWNPQSIPMKKQDGEWVVDVHLSRGKHLYKFIVDGKWILDPGNKLWEQNEHNTGNSVYWFDE